MPSVRQLIVDTVLQNLPVGLLVFDPNGVIMVSSPSAVKILGYSPQLLVNKPFRDVLLNSPENEAFVGLLAEAVEEGLGFTHREAGYQSPEGNFSRLLLTASILEKAGKNVGVVVIMDDVTALRQAQEREAGILREKNRLQYDMIESMNTLALSVAHQIRNRTATIGGFSLKLLRDLRAIDHSTVYPEIIFQEAKRLEDVVGAVVRLASISRLRPEMVAVRPIIDKAVADVSKVARGLCRQVAWNIDVEDHELLADPELLRLALTEVLLNCLEFNNRGDVSIAILARKGDGYTIGVTDNGPGVAAGSKPFVFDPFYSTKPQGAGIGLTIVRKIVIEHDGHVSLESPGGGGALVRIRLGGVSGETLFSPPCEEGKAFDAGLLARKAAVAGVDVCGLNYIDAVRKLQAWEGYSPCFGYGLFDRCGQTHCGFRNDCMQIRIIGVPTGSIPASS
jgi:PAS domain S-box-containing protein